MEKLEYLKHTRIIKTSREKGGEIKGKGKVYSNRADFQYTIARIGRS